MTHKNQAAVSSYISDAPDDRQEILQTVHELIVQAVPHLEPHVMLGMAKPMIGYGTFHYRYASGQEGDWSVIALANQKNYVSVYLCAVDEQGQYIAEANAKRLGKVSVGKSCIRFKKLEDIDLAVLRELCIKSDQLIQAGGFGV